jgi:hypothetical protein
MYISLAHLFTCWCLSHLCIHSFILYSIHLNYSVNISVWTPSQLCSSLKCCSMSGVYMGHKYTTIGLHMGITLALQSNAWTVFALSKSGVVGSNTTQGMDVCMRLFCVCFVLCVGSGLMTCWSPVQGVLSTSYRIRELKKRQGSDKRSVEHR